MKKVVLSCGPIPAMLDSVKFITNRFRGGLAFKTASELKQKGYDITIVKWKYTDIVTDDFKVVNVTDVVEYYNWFEMNAGSYDAFIMAAAVANLMPSNPYKGKFPSHNYSVGEQFDIKFEIAPRAIDIIKKNNPKCCLIGYKLFDSDDEQLIEAARLTLKESKANVIFANTPSEAKTRKLAILADNSVIEMNFEEHVEFMIKAIEAEYFSTIIKENIDSNDIGTAKKLVGYFENERFKAKFGTIAIKLPDGSMVTTSRGHRSGAVRIENIDTENKIVYSDGKATLNAPLMWNILKNKPAWTYVIHRHMNDILAEDTKNMQVLEYEFAGTTQEANIAEKLRKEDITEFVIKHHGYMMLKQIEQVNWEDYYEVFPDKYFSTPEKIVNYITEIENNPRLRARSLEVGGNKANVCGYNCDPNMINLEGQISWTELKEIENFFDVIILRNSINYLTEKELKTLKKVLHVGGTLIANGFISAPKVKVTDREVALSKETVEHYLMDGDQILHHTFFNRGKEDYERLGFNTEDYSDKAMYIYYTKEA